MNIPRWIFDECVRLGYAEEAGAGVKWNSTINPAWMIYKLILIDRKRRKEGLDSKPL